MDRNSRNNPMLSIVVPVYNVERWLDRCVESILGQNFEGFELILVDDGSPDNSGQMCDAWADKDNRIVVIHKSNGGLSDARNAGIAKARGKYITFADSDDYLLPGIYDKMIAYMEENTNVDLIEFSVHEFAGGPKEHYLLLDDEVFDNPEDYWFSTSAYAHTYAWNKIYRRELFNKVRFPKGLIFEDVYTLPRILQQAKSIATSSEIGYNYCWNSEGLTQTSTGREMKMLLGAHLPIIEKYVNKKDLADEWRKEVSLYYMHVANIQITTYLLTKEKPLLPYFDVDTSIFTNKVTKAKAMIIKRLGVETLCKMMKTIQLFHR